ncbi:glycoside hydrolase family 2 TIM barrel-domain containing protein [Leifsonia kafniensis]|uniref:Glycoside hydrolase family 2 TIM barrel-domain containing protein n=1 Tax=Leifsonia kafniensis TaxID=475957 RepID=A0ABP7JZL4_9MICO
MTRISFNANWTVRPKVSPYAQLQGQHQDATAITLPHDALIRAARVADAPTGGRNAYFPGGVFEYEKTFDVPAGNTELRMAVEFDGVYRDAMVFVNGVFAAQRPNGYSAFVVELDPYLLYGQPNTIRVDARSHDDSRWYTGAGIYRNTTLIVTDPVHVADHGIRVTTPTIEPGHAVTVVATQVENGRRHRVTATLTTELLDDTDRVINLDRSPVTLRPGGSAAVRQRLLVDQPRLWSVDSPTLYKIRTTLEIDGRIADAVSTPFGIRRIDVDPVRGLRINGETIKLRGACVHHDNGLLGAATISRAEERRIELLRAAGFNAIRSSHNPLSEAMLDACDRLGMLVMDETFDMWLEGKSSFDYSLNFAEWWERDVEAMVQRDFNHASVIFYSIGNEILETGDPLGSEWGRRLAEKVRSLDDTRLVTNGVNGFVSVLRDVVEMMGAAGGDQGAAGGVNDAMTSAADFMNQVSASPLVTERTAESFSILDVAGLNYGDGRYVLDRDLFPNRVIVGSETFPTKIAEYWRLVLENSHLIGDFTWTGWDYLGEVGVGRVRYADDPQVFEAPYPWITSWTGDIDITGVRRSMSYYRETVFGLRHTPYIAVLRPDNHGRTVMPGLWSWSDSLASWTWDSPAESPIDVEVYSDADEVELLVNGKSKGTRLTGYAHDFIARWNIAYEPGEIIARAITDGQEVARTVLRTAGPAARISATADRTLLNDDHHDLAFIAIELHDEHGALASQADRAVSVEIEGSGVLQAFGSGRPDNAESYSVGHHTSFDGRLLAIIRPTGPGQIEVRVRADGLEPAELLIEVAPAPENLSDQLPTL